MTDLLGTTIPRYPLITSRTGAANSEAFVVSTASGYEAVTLTAHGLSTGEAIPIQTQDAGGEWADASTIDPVTSLDRDIELTYTANTISITSVGVFRVAKGITSAAASVTLYR